MMTNNAVQKIIADAHNDSARSDFETARANIHDMIDTAQKAIMDLSEIANQSQQPRAFEVLAKLVETTVKANESLLVLQTKIREIGVADAPINEKAQTINNNLFVGSTAEFQAMIRKIQKNEPVIVENKDPIIDNE